VARQYGPVARSTRKIAGTARPSVISVYPCTSVTEPNLKQMSLRTSAAAN